MTILITRSHIVGFFSLWSHFKELLFGVVVTAQTDLIARLYAAYNSVDTTVCTHLFHDMLKSVSGHLTGRALDWFDVLGYKDVEDKTTDCAHLKQALTEQFPVVRNRSELETRFYASYQNHNQKSSDFVYELLKIHKQLKLDMREEKLLDHVISRLEPQLLDYGEVRHPQTTSNLLQIIDKYTRRGF
ncbi:uncharacterized protein TNCV_305101 [Trichonephila clavipes]|nr:uncharacterized protein TNCV_305101 [Trichonephila clavipes]